MSLESVDRYVRATIAYDGTDYEGFQIQARGHTVQGVLEAALYEVTQAKTRIAGSGRTDSGVHALGQVIAFRTPWPHELPTLQRALNAVLPQDVVVLEIGPAAPGWHPRFSAQCRHYRYTVLSQPWRSPLERRYVHQVTQPLDLAALQAGADLLVGEHDFAGFGHPCQGESTVRRMYSAQWQQDGLRFTFDIVGNAFLRGMVRRLVGTLLQVGMAFWPLSRITDILAGRDLRLSAPPAPARGLCLMRVEYDS